MRARTPYDVDRVTLHARLHARVADFVTATRNRVRVRQRFDGDVAGLKAVRDGILTATMTQQTQGMGRLALQSALDLIAGKTLPKDQLQDAVLTTKENVEPFITKHP